MSIADFLLSEEGKVLNCGVQANANENGEAQHIIHSIFKKSLKVSQRTNQCLVKYTYIWVIR